MKWLKNLYKRYQYWRYGPYRVGDLVVLDRGMWSDGHLEIIVRVTEHRYNSYYRAVIVKTTLPAYEWLFPTGDTTIFTIDNDKHSSYIEETKEQRLLKKIKQLETNFKERKDK